MGQNHQSHLCCCLDNTSPRLAFTSTSTAASGCSMPRPEELVPVSPCSCPPRGPRLFHSQVNFTSKIVLAKCDFWLSLRSHFTSQECACKVHFWLSLRSHFTSQEHACKCTFDFHSEVTSPLKNVLARAPLTFTHKSLHCCLHPIRENLPLWHGFFLWRSHPALVSLIQPSGATHPAAQDAHCGLGFARGAISAQILKQGAIRPSGQGRTLLFPILFVAQVPAQLCSSLLQGDTLLK